MAKERIIVIAPLSYALTHGLMLLPSLKQVLQALNKEYAQTWDVLEETKNGVHTVYVRPENTPLVKPLRWINGVKQYDKKALLKAVAPVGYAWLRINMMKRNADAIGIPDNAWFNKHYSVSLIPELGKPRVMWVDYKWYTRSSLRKILYTAKKNEQYTVWIDASNKIPYTTGEELTRSIQAYADLNGSVFFGGKLTDNVFDIIDAADEMHIHKENVISHIYGAKVCIMMNKLKDPDTGKYTLPNDGRFLKPWQMEKFYQHNPDGELYIHKDNELHLMLPEDKEWKRPKCEYENVFAHYKDLLKKPTVDEFIRATKKDKNSKLYHADRKFILQKLLENPENYPELDFSDYIEEDTDETT